MRLACTTELFQTLMFKGEANSGGKKIKQQVIDLLFCNMDGSEKKKKKSVVIGTSKRP